MNDTLKKKDYLSSIWSVEERQVSQQLAGYDPIGMQVGKGCANCNWYVPGDQGCVIVQGDISPTGLSKFWMAKEEYVQEPVPVVIVEPPAQQKNIIRRAIDAVTGAPNIRASFTLFKSADELRFLCVPTNAYMDLEYDVITSAAHKEFVDWCNKNEQYPELWLWHLAGTKCGQVDWLDYDDSGFVCASGTIDKEWEDVVIKAVTSGDVAMSHGFIPIGFDHDGFVAKYRSFEYTILPRNFAANVWTSFNVTKGLEEMAMTPQSKQWLENLGIPPDKISEFEQRNKEVGDKLKAAGVITKEGEGTTEESTSTTTTTSTTDEAITKGFASVVEMIQELGSTVTGLATEVAAVKSAQASIKEEVEKSLDERAENIYKAKVATHPVGFKASESNDNVTSDSQNQAIRGNVEGKEPEFMNTILGNTLESLHMGVR